MPPGASRAAASACRDAEDERDGRREPAGPEREAISLADREARRADGRLGVARWVTSAGEGRPQAAAIDGDRRQPPDAATGDHVLVEAQLSARPEHAPRLAQRG